MGSPGSGVTGWGERESETGRNYAPRVRFHKPGVPSGPAHPLFVPLLGGQAAPAHCGPSWAAGKVSFRGRRCERPPGNESVIVAEPEELSQWIERFRSERQTLPPLEVLLGEHHIIGAVLDAMERASARLAGGDSGAGEFWHRAVDFVENFIDGCHHQKEEEVLFPLLLGRARSERVGPIVALKHEHVEGRELKDALCKAADGSDPEKLLAAAATYIRLLREHMKAEEQGPFEQDRRISARHARRMRDEFARLERETLGAGGYDRYLDLALEICRESGTESDAER